MKTPIFGKSLAALLLCLLFLGHVEAQSEPEEVPDTIRFAVIGDYGKAGAGEESVADLVKSWEPDFIITTGDNNYDNGSAETIDDNIGQYYHDYIYPYTGEYGDGATENRFFPTLGNHDWQTDDAQPYLDYFTLPGNERYYDFTMGAVHFFMLDSLYDEPDGITPKSVQAQWLQTELANSTSPWKLVVMHVPPYSSGHHGSHEVMQWPYAEWGATATLSGHDHVYERLLIDDFPYFVNGAGGGGLYAFEMDAVPGSEVRYNADYGAMLVEATNKQITFQFYAVADGGKLIDTYTIDKTEETPS